MLFQGFKILMETELFQETLLGIPKEPFGFSNDAKGKFGPPKWQDAVFIFNEIKSRNNFKIKKL